ncbi:N-acetylmuramoyl-L-alanine amidase [Alkalihalobacillus sp. MEB130]|uniref:N-acetylmuramoyl-L-alanine amidase n=1 Tax=Alkalihalobacillus sp. MEB130 TaxID=2976704 RepID=UPI0028DE6ADF|nr:N-acetylmuramoyl-L-alanine amidase [Alkalihalobacillus sp. MEB130]MDT8858834.1 N-acetylmuramoyl-L-alanine amidase [Alkalihalobacillus sp. MEB130]
MNDVNLGRKSILILLLLATIAACSALDHIDDKEEETITLRSSEKPGHSETFLIQKLGVQTEDRFLPLENSRPRVDVTHIMLHFMSNAANKPNEPYEIDDAYSLFLEYGVSAHYVIDREGSIHRFVPEERAAFHAGKGNLPDYPHYKDRLNDYSIGIELLAIGTEEEMLAMIPGLRYDSIDPSLIGYTDVQYETLNLLLDDLYERYPTIPPDRNHVIGHDEYAPDRKTDPGSLFDWSAIGYE